PAASCIRHGNLLSFRCKEAGATAPVAIMPVYQSYPYDGHLLPRRPSVLRRVGEAIISWADRREVAQAERALRSGSPQQLPAHLRRDVGLSPLPDPPSHLRWW